MKDKVLNMLKIGTTCPNCHKPIRRLKFKAVYAFCPHCKVHLYKKHKTKQPTSTSKKLTISLLLPLLMFLPWLLENYPHIQNFFEGMQDFFIFSFLAFLILILVFLFDDRLFAYGKYEKGVDFLQDLNKHPFFGRNQAIQCHVCHSFQMTDARSYKHLLFMNDKKIPKQIIENNPHFIGCVNCTAQYEKIHDSNPLAIVYMMLLFILVIVNGFFQNTLNHIFLVIQHSLSITLSIHISLILIKSITLYVLYVILVFTWFSFINLESAINKTSLKRID